MSLKAVAAATQAVKSAPSAGMATTRRAPERSGVAGNTRSPDGCAPPPQGGASTNAPPGARAHSAAATAPEPPPVQSKTVVRG